MVFGWRLLCSVLCSLSVASLSFRGEGVFVVSFQMFFFFLRTFRLYVVARRVYAVQIPLGM